MDVLSPISGRVIPLSEVPDEVFAEGMAGDGCGVVPSESGEVVAPLSGTLIKLFEGGHAFGIESDGGVELIVHVGLDTIELQGDGFEKLRKQGEEVKAGEAIVRFDIEAIRDAGYDPVTVVVVTNPEDHEVSGQAEGEIEAGNRVFEVK